MPRPFTGKNINCLICNKEFYVPKCRLMAKYCSAKCDGVSRRKSEEHKKAQRKFYYYENREYINARQNKWNQNNYEKRKAIKDRWRAIDSMNWVKLFGSKVTYGK